MHKYDFETTGLGENRDSTGRSNEQARPDGTGANGGARNDNQPALRMQDCHKFGACNAAICPLAWSKTQHSAGDIICSGMNEYVKIGGPRLVAEVFGMAISQVVGEEIDSIRASVPDINNRLKRTCTTGSSIRRGQRGLESRQSRCVLPESAKNADSEGGDDE